MPTKDPTIRNIIARYLSPAESLDLGLLAAMESTALGRRVTKQELAARYIRERIEKEKIENRNKIS